MAAAGTRDTTVLAAAVGVLAAATYTLYYHLHWIALYIPSWDLAIFAQLAKAYSSFSAPIVPLKGEEFNLLGDHFHPILVLLGPVWAVWPSAKALLVLQAALFGLSAFPLTRLAARRHGLGWGGFFGLTYAFCWGLQFAAAVHFHEIAFGVPLIAFALAAHLDGRPGAAAAWAGALVFVKEDLGLTVVAFGLVTMFFPPRGLAAGAPTNGSKADAAAFRALTFKRRRMGLALVGWGAIWFVIAVFVVLPAFNPVGEYAYTDRLAGLITFFSPPEKWFTVLMIVTTTGLIGLRSPIAMMVVPTLLWRFAGDVPSYWGIRWHYNAILMPIVFTALLDGVAGRPPERLLTVRGVWGLRMRRFLLSRFRGQRVWRCLPLILAAAATLSLGSSMSLLRLTRPLSYEVSDRWDGAQAIVAAIPEGASVESDPVLMALLVPRAEVYWFKNDNPAPDFVVRDSNTPTWGWDGPPPDMGVWATQRHGVPYEVLLDVDGFQLAGRTDKSTTPG